MMTEARLRELKAAACLKDDAVACEVIDELLITRRQMAILDPDGVGRSTLYSVQHLKAIILHLIKYSTLKPGSNDRLVSEALKIADEMDGTGGKPRNGKGPLS